MPLLESTCPPKMGRRRRATATPALDELGAPWRSRSSGPGASLSWAGGAGVAKGSFLTDAAARAPTCGFTQSLHLASFTACLSFRRWPMNSSSSSRTVFRSRKSNHCYFVRRLGPPCIPQSIHHTSHQRCCKSAEAPHGKVREQWLWRVGDLFPSRPSIRRKFFEWSAVRGRERQPHRRVLHVQVSPVLQVTSTSGECRS